MIERLPLNWARTLLSQLVEPRTERVDPRDCDEYRYLGLEQVEPHTSRVLGYVDATTMHSSAVRFRAGDVLYGRLRPYLNKVVLASQSGIASAEFIVLPESDLLDQRFLALRLSARDFVHFACTQ